MKEIQLTQGYTTQVDDQNFDKLNAFKWCADVARNDDGSIKNVYAARYIVVNGKQTFQRMHRFIKGITDPKIKVDHEDHNGLNNLASNLRIATNADNNRNQRLSRANSSGYKGVTWCTTYNKWRARIGDKGKRIHLGCFTDLQDARDAYDAAALKYFGEFAYTNAMMEAQNQLGETQ